MSDTQEPNDQSQKNQEFYEERVQIYETFFKQCDALVGSKKEMQPLHAIIGVTNNKDLQTHLNQIIEQVKDLEKAIQIYELLGELARGEKMMLDKINQAYETLLEYDRMEKLEQKKFTQANEIVQDLAKEEIVDRDRFLNAYQSVERLATEEIKFSNRIICALEAVVELARMEQIEKDKIIQEKERLIEKKEKNDTTITANGTIIKRFSIC